MSGESKAPQIKRYVIQVNPGRPRLGIDLTLCPKSVLPDARNQKTEFTARIYAFKDGRWVYPGEKRKITFSFKEVSKERGICMNYPIKKRDNVTPASAIESNTNPDLFFPEDDDRMRDFDFDEDETDADANKKCPTEILMANDNPAHSHHYKKATTKNAVTEAKVLVRCEDYGAFGILKAEAADCEILKPRERAAGCSQELGDNDVKFPRDDNGNNIADSAAQDKNKDGTKALPDKDEDDTPRGNGDPGDGFTNYEEYRGFIVGEVDGPKSHKRTDIKKKQIFIHDKDKIGYGFFGRSGLEILNIPGPEFYGGDSTDGDKSPDAGTQIINFNRDPNVGGDQHGLRLVKEDLGGNVLGQAVHARFGFLPKFVNRVAIDVAAHEGEHANALSASIAHELGHCSHLEHHGSGAAHDHGGAKSDPNGGVTSGNVSCVMRYDNYRSQWCHVVDGNCHTHAIANAYNEDPGTTFCNSKSGTGCNNIAGHFNNSAAADRGECKKRIKVKDW